MPQEEAEQEESGGQSSKGGGWRNIKCRVWRYTLYEVINLIGISVVVGCAVFVNRALWCDRNVCALYSCRR